ncbi:transposase [Pirellulaceae bacterium SH501]
MSSIFLPLIFLPTRLLIPEVAIKGRKMGGRKMKCTSSHRLFRDATWINMVTHFTHGITNAVAEGIDSKIMSIQRRTGGYRNGGLDPYPQ